ncbi:hypothetical protein N9X46_02395 [Paracoccaceae bacterium]|nr:hypothetical protein [Paracoccaceae bacterium]
MRVSEQSVLQQKDLSKLSQNDSRLSLHEYGDAIGALAEFFKNRQNIIKNKSSMFIEEEGREVVRFLTFLRNSSAHKKEWKSPIIHIF